MAEKRKWYNNGKEELLLRHNDIVPEGFSEGRIERDCKFNRLLKTITKEQLIQLYIVENISFDKLFIQLNITRKDLRRLLSHYSIKKTQKQAYKNNNYKRSQEEIDEVARKSSETQKKHWELKSDEFKRDFSEKRREQMLNRSKEQVEATSEKIRQSWVNKTEEQKQEINKKRSASCKKVWENPEILKKQQETLKKNLEIQKGRLCRTISEQKLYDILSQLYEDVKYNVYVDERYPFYCDFYIPSLDLFIELNAHPSHGKLPYYMADEEYINNFPDEWLDTFQRRDVEKLQFLNKNNLNFITIYPQSSLNINKEINNKTKNKELIDICYKSQK